MKKQIQIWGTRTLSVIFVVFVAQRWGMPMYKQYFTPKKVTVFVPTAKVQVGSFSVSFHEIGTLDAVNSTQVVSSVTGKIIRLVPEGKVVKKDELLVELDTADIQREVRQAELGYRNALADVERTKSDMDILKASNETDRKKTQAQFEFDKNELERAKQELARQQRLADKKLVPGSAVDKAEFDVRSKELALKKSEMDIELKNKELAEKESQKMADIRKVEFASNIALSTLDEAKSKLKNAFIKAPSGGMVVYSNFWAGDSHRTYKVGDMATPRNPICSLPDLTNMQVNVQVGEADAPKLRLGLPVIVKMEAIPGKTFHGTINEISSLATESNPWEGGTPGRKNFSVKVSLKENDPKALKPGMTADVEFICDSIKDAVYVPLESVIEREGKTLVFLKTPTGYQRKFIELGKSNDNFVVVSKGLEKGETIALRDPTKPAEDQESGAKENKAEDKKEKKPAPIPGAGG